MCGICGIVRSGAVPDANLIQAMMGMLSHRGPDASGFYRDDRVALGHTRLAIVDTGNGIQPMCNEDESVWVTFNGEIFNHVELRAQLQDRGHLFRTHCDTEVIVHAWEEWGPACLDRFNGQWAFALWDRRNRELVLSRDRYGVRPLYYARTANQLLFASEMKALFVDPEVSRELDPAGLDEALTFWSPVAPRTPFVGINQVPPGSYVSLRESGEEHGRYWTPAFPERGGEDPGSVAEHSEGLRERLIAATKLRFERSDVPVGAYLSGGLDSTVTASIIASFTDVELDTFSLRFGNAEFDEGTYQQRLVGSLGTTHHTITVSERDIADAFPDVVWHAEHPLLRTAPAPMFLLSRLVRESGYKVVVTGEGADEVLAGYDIFREAKVRYFRGRNPSSTVRARAVELLYPWMARSPNLAPAFSQGFFGRNLDVTDPGLSHRPRWDSTSTLKAMLTDDARDGRDTTGELLAQMPPTSSQWDPLARAQWLEIVTLLPGYILSSQGDRMLMAHSIEGRFPFLDVHVGAYANAAPARQKILGLDEKHLLKRAFGDMVPDDILHRPKQPYRAPDAASFFAGGAPDWLEDVTSEAAVAETGVFRPPIVSKLLDKARRQNGQGLSNTDNMRLVAVLSTQLLSRHVAGTQQQPPTPPKPMAVFDFASTSRGEA